MEKVTCCLCHSNQSAPLLSREDRFKRQGESWQIVRCANCGLVYLNPRPAQAELDDFYPDDYESYLVVSEHNRDPHAQRALARQLDFVERYQPARGRLLDIGCAAGNFLNLARQHSWQVYGVELIERSARLARQVHGLEVHTGTLEQANFAAGSFNVITLWDVLEHLPDPVETFRQIHVLLQPGGLVIFSIPNLSSFDRHLFGRAWIGWDPPRHFNLFEVKTLQALFEQTGFSLVDRRCFLGGKGTFDLSVTGLVQRHATLEKLWRLSKPLVSALFWPYRQLAYLTTQGPIITYVARREELTQATDSPERSR